MLRIKKRTSIVLAFFSIFPVLIGSLAIQFWQVPLVIHVLSSALYGCVGAFLLSLSIGTKARKLHRLLGPLLAASGILSSGSGIWMAFNYLTNGTSMVLLQLFRLFFGSLMFGALFSGYLLARRRKYMLHSIWMLRAYAIGYGAVSQMGLLMIVSILNGELTDTLYTLIIGLSWVINLLVAELFILKEHKEMGGASYESY